MKRYFSTFTTGTQDIIETALKKRKGRITIDLLLDGLVLYRTDYSERELRDIRFFNNTFVVLYFFDKLNPTIKSLEKVIKVVTKDSSSMRKLISSLPKRRRNFKIVTSLENQTVAVERQ